MDSGRHDAGAPPSAPPPGWDATPIGQAIDLPPENDVFDATALAEQGLEAQLGS